MRLATLSLVFLLLIPTLSLAQEGSSFLQRLREKRSGTASAVPEPTPALREQRNARKRSKDCELEQARITVAWHALEKAKSSCDIEGLRKIAARRFDHPCFSQVPADDRARINDLKIVPTTLAGLERKMKRVDKELASAKRAANACQVAEAKSSLFAFDTAVRQIVTPYPACRPRLPLAQAEDLRMKIASGKLNGGPLRVSSSQRRVIEDIGSRAQRLSREVAGGAYNAQDVKRKVFALKQELNRARPAESGFCAGGTPAEVRRVVSVIDSIPIPGIRGSVVARERKASPAERVSSTTPQKVDTPKPAEKPKVAKKTPPPVVAEPAVATPTPACTNPMGCEGMFDPEPRY